MKATTPENIHYDRSKDCCLDPTADDLFPDLLHLQMNVLNKGRVFGVYVESCGVGVQAREVVVDKEAFQRCSESPNFRKCLDLSLAKLALQEAVIRF